VARSDKDIILEAAQDDTDIILEAAEPDQNIIQKAMDAISKAVAPVVDEVEPDKGDIPEIPEGPSTLDVLESTLGDAKFAFAAAAPRKAQVGEALVSIGSAIPAAAAGAVKGLYQSVIKRDIYEFPEVFNATMESLTFEPSGPIARDIVNKVGEMIEGLAKARKFIGETVFKATGSPALATATEATLAGVVLIGPFAFGRGRKPTRPQKELNLRTEKDGTVVDAETGRVVRTKEGKEVTEAETGSRIEPRIEVDEAAVADLVRQEKQIRTETAEVQRAIDAIERRGVSEPFLVERRGPEPLTPKVSPEPPRSQAVVDPVLEKVLKGIEPDISTYTNLRQRIFRPIEGPKGGVIDVPVLKDIGVIRRDLSGMVAPGKFVSDLHPVLKWGIDKMELSRRRIEIMVDEIIHAPEFVSKPFSGLTARRKSTPVATNKGALTSYERLSSEKQQKILKDAEPWDTAAVEPSRVQMEAAGWDESMIFAYQRLRDGSNKVVVQVNTLAEH